MRQSTRSPLGTEPSLGVALCPGNSLPLWRHSLTACPCQQSTACGLGLDFFSHQDWLSPTFPHSPSRCRVPIQDPGGLGFFSLPLPSRELTSSCGACVSPGILSTGRLVHCSLGVAVELPGNWGNSYPGVILGSLLGPDAGAHLVTECLDPGLGSASHFSLNDSSASSLIP